MKMNKKIFISGIMAVILLFVVVFYINLNEEDRGGKFTMEVKENDSKSNGENILGLPQKVGSLKVHAGSVKSIEIISS